MVRQRAQPGQLRRVDLGPREHDHRGSTITPDRGGRRDRAGPADDDPQRRAREPATQTRAAIPVGAVAQGRIRLLDRACAADDGVARGPERVQMLCVASVRVRKRISRRFMTSRAPYPGGGAIRDPTPGLALDNSTAASR